MHNKRRGAANIAAPVTHCLRQKVAYDRVLNKQIFVLYFQPAVFVSKIFSVLFEGAGVKLFEIAVKQTVEFARIKPLGGAQGEHNSFVASPLLVYFLTVYGKRLVIMHLKYSSKSKVLVNRTFAIQDEAETPKPIYSPRRQ